MAHDDLSSLSNDELMKIAQQPEDHSDLHSMSNEDLMKVAKPMSQDEVNQYFGPSSSPYAVGNQFVRKVLSGATYGASDPFVQALITKQDPEKMAEDVKQVKVFEQTSPELATAGTVTGAFIPGSGPSMVAEGLSAGATAAGKYVSGALSENAANFAGKLASEGAKAAPFLSAGVGFASGNGLEDRLTRAAKGLAFSMGLKAAGNYAPMIMENVPKIIENIPYSGVSKAVIPAVSGIATNEIEKRRKAVGQ